jgi:hypothetical protein
VDTKAEESGQVNGHPDRQEPDDGDAGEEEEQTVGEILRNTSDNS